MKVHIGADAGAGMAHSASFTAANVHDRAEAHKLIREDDAFANLDAGYIGIEQREEIQENEHLSNIEWRVNQRKGKARKPEKEVYQNVIPWVGTHNIFCVKRKLS
jgi:IS5 family transposase